MSDSLTTGAERLAKREHLAKWLAAMEDLKSFLDDKQAELRGHQAIIEAAAEEIAADPGVKALVELAKVMDRQTLIHPSTRIDLAGKALKLWEHGDA